MNGYDLEAKMKLLGKESKDRATWIAPENVQVPSSMNWIDKGKHFKYKYK